MAEKEIKPISTKEETLPPQKTSKKSTKSEKKETPTEGGKKHKMNPLFLIAAAGAGIYLWISSKGATAATGGGTTTTTTTTGSGSGTTGSNNGSSNIQTGLQPATGGSYNPPAQSSSGSGSGPGPSTTLISAYPATVTVNQTAAHVFSQPNTSSSLAGSQVLNNGDTFTVIGYVMGVAVDGVNSAWWVSQYGNYVWSGTTAQRPDTNMPVMSASQIASASSTGSSAPVSTQPITTSTISTNSSVPPAPNPNVISNFPANVTVNSAVGVNVRSAPNPSAAQAGSDFLSYNTQFQVIGYVHGTSVDGEDRWWVSQFNNYVWVGGTQQKPGSDVAAMGYTAPNGTTTSTSGLASVQNSTSTYGNLSGTSTSGTTTNSGAPTLLIMPVVTPTQTTKSVFPMSVTVNNGPLYVRSAPNTSASLAGSRTLQNGDTFVATSYVVGQNVSGENRWWVSQYGNYVWVGGTLQKPS